MSQLIDMMLAQSTDCIGSTYHRSRAHERSLTGRDSQRKIASKGVERTIKVRAVKDQRFEEKKQWGQSCERPGWWKIHPKVGGRQEKSQIDPDVCAGVYSS